MQRLPRPIKPLPQPLKTPSLSSLAPKDAEAQRTQNTLELFGLNQGALRAPQVPTIGFLNTSPLLAPPNPVAAAAKPAPPREPIIKTRSEIAIKLRPQRARPSVAWLLLTVSVLGGGWWYLFHSPEAPLGPPGNSAASNSAARQGTMEAPKHPVVAAAVVQPQPTAAPKTEVKPTSATAETKTADTKTAAADDDKKEPEATKVPSAPAAAPAGGLAAAVTRNAGARTQSPSSSSRASSQKTSASKPSSARTTQKPAAASNSSAPPFNAAAARTALSSAAGSASGCRQLGDPAGSARVLVTFSPNGRVISAAVTGARFAGTRAGGCIAARMRSARVPAFSGSPVTVSKTVTIQ